MRHWITPTCEGGGPLGLNGTFAHEAGTASSTPSKFRWFIDQQGQMIGEPLFLWPQWCHQNQWEPCLKIHSQQYLLKQCKRREDIGFEMVPRMLKCILIPCRWIWNWQDVSRKLGIRSSGKQIWMGMEEDPIDPLTYSWQEGPFRGKNLVGMSGWLSWSARTFFFPGMFLADRETESCLVHEVLRRPCSTTHEKQCCLDFRDKQQPWRCHSSGRHSGSTTRAERLPGPEQWISSPKHWYGTTPPQLLGPEDGPSNPTETHPYATARMQG